MCTCDDCNLDVLNVKGDFPYSQDKSQVVLKAPSDSLKLSLTAILQDFRKKVLLEENATALVSVELCTGLTDQGNEKITTNCENDLTLYGVSSGQYCS